MCVIWGARGFAARHASMLEDLQNIVMLRDAWRCTAESQRVPRSDAGDQDPSLRTHAWKYSCDNSLLWPNRHIHRKFTAVGGDNILDLLILVILNLAY
jgi:hypothetical protein